MAEKITIAQKFAATIAILEGSTPAIEFTTEDAIDFLTDRAEKATSKSKAAHKTKPEVVEFRNAVATWLSEQSGPVTNKVAAAELGVSAQKSASALNWLAANGVAVKTEGEKKSDPVTYAIA